jgi:hypothetical protein
MSNDLLINVWILVLGFSVGMSVAAFVRWIRRKRRE